MTDDELIRPRYWTHGVFLQEDRRYGPERQPIKHGTPGGYKTHRKRGEDACAACKAAEAQKSKNRRAQRRNTLQSR